MKKLLLVLPLLILFASLVWAEGWTCKEISIQESNRIKPSESYHQAIECAGGKCIYCSDERIADIKVNE